MEKTKGNTIDDFDFLIGNQYPPPPEAWEYLCELERRSRSRGEIAWNMVNAFLLGRIFGIRQERARRKEKHEQG